MIPTVSVIIPTRDRSKLLRQAIESVLTQTYSDYEIIVVDDGSSENIAAVAGSYDNRVRYERLPSGGVSKARNHGIRCAKGRYVAFLDSDDLFAPDKLQRQVAWLERHPEIGMTYSGYRSVNEALEPIAEHQAVVYSDSKSMLTTCTIATPTVMVRHEVFEQVGYFDESMHLAEDIDLWTRIFRLYPIAPIPELLTLVRIHSHSTPRDPEAVLNAYIHLLTKAFRADPTIGFLERRRLLARVHYLCAAEVLALVDHQSSDPNKYQTYNYYFVKATRYFPFSRSGLKTLVRHYSVGGRRLMRRLLRRNQPYPSDWTFVDKFTVADWHAITGWLKKNQPEYVFELLLRGDMLLVTRDREREIPVDWVCTLLERLPNDQVLKWINENIDDMTDHTIADDSERNS